MFARVYTCISIGTLWYNTQCLLKLNHNHCSWNQDIAWLLGQLLHIASLCCSVLLCWCSPTCPNLGVWASRWLASSCQLAKQQIRHYYDSSTRSLCFILWPRGRSTKHRPLTVSHSQQRCPSFVAQDYHDLLVVTVTQWTKDKLESNSLPASSRTLPWKFSLGLMLFISFIKDADFCVKPYQYQMGRTHTTSRPQRLCWHKVLVWLETGASAFCDQSKYVPFGTASTLAMLFKEETARLTFRHFVFGHLPRQLWGPTTLLGVALDPLNVCPFRGSNHSFRPPIQHQLWPPHCSGLLCMPAQHPHPLVSRISAHEYVPHRQTDKTILESNC